MKRRLSVVVLTLIAGGWCFGQSGRVMTPALAIVPVTAGSWYPEPALQAQASAAKQQAPVIMVQLSKSLDSRKLTAGNAIEAKVTNELRWNGTIIPRGSKVTGHITEASSRAKGDPASALGMVFDRITLKDGTDLPLKANIQAVGPRPGFGSGDTDMQNPAPVSAPGGPGSMGGAIPDPRGLGAPQTNFPPNPAAGTASPPNQGNRQDSGVITEQSTGVVGLPDLQLRQDSILASSGEEVKLAAGSRVLLRVQSQ
ncbi:MAG: hypothetical protein WAL85_05035 [Candidatus Korobacteraceae bacterium]